MGYIIAILFALAGSAFAPTVLAQYNVKNFWQQATRVSFFFVAVAVLLSTSFVFIGAYEVGQLKRVYFGDSLPSGRIIATTTEGAMKGPQADILGPGFNFQLGLNILYDVDKTYKVVSIEDGMFGYLVAKDGRAMPPGQTYAEAFAPGTVYSMLDANYFLDGGSGIKGPQTTVLPPGDYRINHYLWTITAGEVTEIPKGHVAVIKANVVSTVNFGDMMAAKPTSCKPTRITDATGGQLAVPLVPVGCIGIWDTPLFPGKYYINLKAYNVTLVDTRVQAWQYQGGFTKRSVNLTVDANGEITQEKSSELIKIPKNAADGAIGIKIDGYTIQQQVRALVQVEPKNAPFIVASVGNLHEVEDRIITPAIQSTTRDLSGQFIEVVEPVLLPSGKPKTDKDGNVVTRKIRRPVQPLDLIERREVLQARVEEKVRPEGLKAGVTVKEVRFLEPDMPPEILLPRKRQQLASQMVATMKEEQKAQQQRIAKENASATADQQGELVKAEIAVQVAELYKKQRTARGKADRIYLEQIAAGQKKQVAVLGEEKVVQLKMVELFLETLAANPTLVGLVGKLVPDTVVFGGGIGDLNGPAAVLKRAFTKNGGNKDAVTLQNIQKVLRDQGILSATK
ncbi:hypothetical protein LCGC14_1662720 [marine sediment metagenome]|uniref:Band 7 domain-containing protein n=1 Tax=marine sediment metagenome TaxID=412755 RepID=A0A0F9K9F3_9ZZZZ